MLRYYAYYSEGGYKEMYIGNSDMTEEDSFFLQLLPVWKERGEKEGNEVLLAKVKKLSALPSIKTLSGNDYLGFPADALVTFSHGGYKVLLKKGMTGEGILTIRDIEHKVGESSENVPPFSICVIGENDEDKNRLNRLFSYIVMNLDNTNGTLSTMFGHDFEKNGLVFHLRKFNEWIRQVTNVSDGKVYANGKGFLIDVARHNYVYRPNGVSREIALKEQSLRGMSTITFGIDGKLRDSHTDTIVKLLALLASGLIIGYLLIQVIQVLSQ